MPAQTSFSERARQAFLWLLDEHDFVVEKEDLMHPFGGAIPPLQLWLRSPRCRIRVGQDMGAVRTEVAPITADDNGGDWLPLGYVIGWLHPGTEHRSSVSIQEFVADWGSAVDRALAEESQATKEYCIAVVQGDFSLRPTSPPAP